MPRGATVVGANPVSVGARSKVVALTAVPKVVTTLTSPLPAPAGTVAVTEAGPSEVTTPGVPSNRTAEAVPRFGPRSSPTPRPARLAGENPVTDAV